MKAIRPNQKSIKAYVEKEENSKEEVIEAIVDKINGLLYLFKDEDKEKVLFTVLEKLYRCKDANIVNVVFQTTDMSLFQTQKGNRKVRNNRKNAIKRALEGKKQINPIQVNENFEVVDGNGRCAAFESINRNNDEKDLPLVPVQFIVTTGLNLDDTLAANTSQYRWTFMDRISSYAGLNNEYSEAFKRLEAIIKDYSNSIKSTPIITMAVGTLANSGNGTCNKMIKEEGILLFSEKDDKNLRINLDILVELKEIMKTRGLWQGLRHQDKMLNAFYYLIAKKGFSAKRFAAALTRVSQNEFKTDDFDTCLASLITIYNKAPGKPKAVSIKSICDDSKKDSMEIKRRYNEEKNKRKR